MTSPGRVRGFTLIEILVALVIVAIILSVSLLSINLAATDREVRDEGERLVALVAAVRDDALFQGREFGLEFVRDAYRFVEFDPYTEQWAAVPDDDLMGDEVRLSRSLPEGMELSVRLEGKQIQLGMELADLTYDKRPGAAPNRYAPHLFIYSSGEITPFELRITRTFDRESVKVEGDLLGNLELAGDDDEQTS